MSFKTTYKYLTNNWSTNLGVYPANFSLSISLLCQMGSNALLMSQNTALTSTLTLAFFSNDQASTAVWRIIQPLLYRRRNITDITWFNIVKSLFWFLMWNIGSYYPSESDICPRSKARANIALRRSIWSYVLRQESKQLIKFLYLPVYRVVCHGERDWEGSHMIFERWKRETTGEPLLDMTRVWKKNCNGAIKAYNLQI